MKSFVFTLITTALLLSVCTSCNSDARIYAKELKAEKLLVEEYIKRNGLVITETMPSEAEFFADENLYYLSSSGLYYRLDLAGRTDQDSLTSSDNLTVELRYLEYTLTEKADTSDFWSPEVFPSWLQYSYGGTTTTLPTGFVEAIGYMRRTESEARLIVTSKLGFDASDVTPYGYKLKIRFAKNSIAE